jgi:hypothetical protein
MLATEINLTRAENVMSDFHRYFKENMEALGLPAPDSLFGTLQSSLTTVTVLLASIDKFGKTTTIADLIGAGTRLEKLGMIGTLSAAFYAGACIGSLAVATGRSMSGGATVADVLLYARTHHLHRPWLAAELYRAPGIYRPKVAGKATHKYAAIQR